jgi:hypothetical protein
VPTGSAADKEASMYVIREIMQCKPGKVRGRREIYKVEG